MILWKSVLMQDQGETGSAPTLVLSRSWYPTATSDMAILSFLLAAGTFLSFYFVYKHGCQLPSPYFSPLRDLPGPKSESFIWGNLGEMQTEEYIKKQEEWVEKYGKVIKYKGFKFSNVSSPTHLLEVAYSIVVSV